MTDSERRNFKRNQKVMTSLVFGIEKLHTLIGVHLESIKQCERPGQVIKTWNGVNGAPHLIFCPGKQYWQDIVWCHYMCKSPCAEYTSGGFVCALLGCKRDKRQACEEHSKTCGTWNMFHRYIDPYIMAYAPIMKIHKENEKFKEEAGVLSLDPSKKIKTKKKR